MSTEIRYVQLEEILNNKFSILLSKVSDYFNNEYIQLYNYYSGLENAVSQVYFDKYFNLLFQFNELMKTIETNKNALLLYYDLVADIEELYYNFEAIQKLPKWLKSVVTNFGYNSNLYTEYVIGQEESLERISRIQEKKITFKDDWFKIAFNSNLTELDYTINGGKIISLENKDLKFSNVNLTSFVDFIYQKSIYGKDIDRNIILQNNDLVALEFDSTLQQSIYILMNLKKGDNPDFPKQGIQIELFSGSNRSVFQMPALIRQLTENFSTDDSIEYIRILGTKIEGDTVFIENQIKTIIGDLIQLNTQTGL